ncbi:MAG: hypothetical protein H6741_14145 [Alphaproteobacteria bacterium]|nr:hypothetical protein [Alphaproteobacteria bacterium]MCB9793856.1 hypothetical protein [Alphaproteobacteria bacterium]
MRRLLLPFAFAVVLGCGSADDPPPGHTPQDAPPSGPAAGGPAPEAAPGEVEVPGEAQFSQEALAAEGGVRLIGELKCPEGRGPFVVQVFPPPPDQGGAESKDGPMGPLVKAPVAQAGPFTLLAPKGRSGVLVGFEDGDGNGSMTPGEPLFFAGGGGPQVMQFTADRTGLLVDCEAAMSGPGGGGGPGGGPGGPGGAKGSPGEMAPPPPQGEKPPKAPAGG